MAVNGISFFCKIEHLLQTLFRASIKWFSNFQNMQLHPEAFDFLYFILGCLALKKNCSILKYFLFNKKLKLLLFKITGPLLQLKKVAKF